MLVVELPRIDPAPPRNSELFDQWISNFVDTYNQAMQQIQDAFASLP